MNKDNKVFKIILLMIILLLFIFVVPNIINMHKRNKIDAMIVQENKVIQSAESFVKDYCYSGANDKTQKECETYYQELPSSSLSDSKEIVTKYVCISDLKKLGYYNDDLKYSGENCQGVVIYEVDKNTSENLSTYSYIKCADKYESNINKQIDKKIIEECFKNISSESSNDGLNKEYILKFEQLYASKNGTESISVKYNNSLPDITIPSREYLITFDYNDKLKENTVLTFKYSFDGYSYNGVKYYDSYGKSDKVWDNKFDATLSVIWNTSNSSKLVFPKPSRLGYTFDGWYTSNTGGEKISDFSNGYEPISDMVLYAKWTANSYKVSFDVNDGNKIEKNIKNVIYDGVYGELPVPEKIGYTFDGWFTSLDFDTKVTKDSKVLNSSNHTLYAKWVANSNTQYQVNHWKQNVDGDDVFNDVNFTLSENEKLYGVTNESVTPDVKNYEGFTSPSGQTIIINSDGSTVVNYYYIRNSYSVILESGLGISEVLGNGIYKYGQTVTISARTKIGYTWSSWSNDVKDETYTFIMGDEDVSITALADANKYFISYDCNGGMGSTNQSNHIYDVEENLRENSCVNEGYTFSGWKDSSDNIFTNKQKVKNLTSINSETILLTAIWEPIEYTISYNQNGGVCVLDDVNVKFNEIIILPSCTRDGYTFINWLSSKGDEFSSGISVSGLSITNGENIIMNAQWKENKYTLTLNSNGATKNGTISVDAVFDSSLPSIEKPLREYKVIFDANGGSVSTTSSTVAYTFNGYYYNDIEYYNSLGEGVRNFNISDDVTLIANWTHASITLPIPERKGYKFDGWYTSDSGGNKIGDGDSTFTPIEDITLFAMWSANTYDITLDSNGATKNGTTNVNAVYDSSLPSIEKPLKEYKVTFDANGGNVSTTSSTAAYTFNGYFYNDIEYYNSSGENIRIWDIDSDVTLIANWTENAITLPTPSRTMHTFNGWYTAKTGGTKVGNGGELYIPNKEITLYAVWTVKEPVVTTSGNLSTFSYQSAYYPSCGLIKATPHYTVTYSADGYSTVTIDTVKLYGGDWYYRSGISNNPSSSSIGATMYFYINGTKISGSVSGTVSKGNWITTNFNKSVKISHTSTTSISIWWAMDDMTLGDVGMWYQGDSSESVGTTNVTLNVP